MGGTHPCSRASLPMRWSVDGRRPPLLTCLSTHVPERGWEAPTLDHVPLYPKLIILGGGGAGNLRCKLCKFFVNLAENAVNSYKFL